MRNGVLSNDSLAQRGYVLGVDSLCDIQLGLIKSNALVKVTNMEDISVQKDRSIRCRSWRIIQLSYSISHCAKAVIVW